ncbi:MAG: hypothetical protein JO320_18920 [Alphaproteobacteria bacterium]|nr:hypothetical protein [Alphaproteobacteria bacterium]MBV9200788.1 hypothetical protein [Alphaproteobacteria bacterium]MBV9377094.1 hypothetical protein [Alphaproteobacteria bacterium]
MPGRSDRAIHGGERPRFEKQDEALVYRVCAEQFKTQHLADSTVDEAIAKLGETGLTEMIAIIGYYTLTETP